MKVLREESSGRLRAGLRAVVPALVTLVLFVIGIAVLGQVFDSPSEGIASGEVILVLFAQVVLYLGLLWVAIRVAAKLEGHDYAAFGPNVDLGWVRNFVLGTAISLVGISVSLWWGDLRGLRAVDLGAAGIDGPDEPLVLGVVLATFVCFFLLGNVYEEVVYRRIVLGNFVEGLATRGFSPAVAAVPATVASLVLFGLYHVPLRGNLVVAVDAALVGVTFALAYLLTGELGLPIGIHFGRLPIELAHGMRLGEVEVLAAVEVTRNTLPANLEVKLVRLGLICLLVLAVVYLQRGEVGVAGGVERRDEPRSSAD